MTDTPARPRQSILGAVLGLGVGVLIGGAITYLGAAEVVSEMRLRGGSDVVEADVQDTRVMSSRKLGTTHEVQYSFTLPGSATRYTLGDATGREGLWTALPEADWEAARASGKVAVRYLPGDPTVSRPVNSDAAPLGDAIAGLVLGLLILLPCLLILIATLRRPSAPRGA